MHAGELSVIGDITVSKLFILLPQKNSTFPFGTTVLYGLIMACTDEIVFS